MRSTSVNAFPLSAPDTSEPVTSVSRVTEPSLLRTPKPIAITATTSTTIQHPIFIGIFIITQIVICQSIRVFMNSEQGYTFACFPALGAKRGQTESTKRCATLI